MKILLGVGIIILLKIMAFQNYVVNLWKDNGSEAVSNNVNFQLSEFDFMMIKIFILLTIGILLFNWLKKKMKHQETPVASLKANVAMLRKEKIVVPQNIELKKKRRNLVRMTKPADQTNPRLLSGKARKLGVTSGELMLAAKIQSSIK